MHGVAEKQGEGIGDVVTGNNPTDEDCVREDEIIKLISLIAPKETIWNRIRSMLPSFEIKRGRYGEEEVDRELLDFTKRYLKPNASVVNDNNVIHDAEIGLEAAALNLLLERNEWDLRDIGKKPESLHAVNTARLNLLADERECGKSVDCVEVICCLLHDTVEDQKITLCGLRNYLSNAVSGLKYASGVTEKLRANLDEIVENVRLAAKTTGESPPTKMNYLIYMERMVSAGKISVMRVKVADRTDQSGQMDEWKYYSFFGKLGDAAKHFIVGIKGQEWAEDFRRRNKEMGTLLYRLYSRLENLKITGDRFCYASFKDFAVVDAAVRHMDKYGEDRTLRGELEGLINACIYNVILTRQRHLIRKHHVRRNQAIEAKHEVDAYQKSGDLYRYTTGTEFDLLDDVYGRAFGGDKRNLKRVLPSDKVAQYIHLELAKRVLMRYRDDTSFRFEWGDFFYKIGNKI